jgi:DNA-binding transcriptional MocR family regulator
MAEPAPINFTRGVPATESFPTDELIAAASSVLRDQAATVLAYGPSAGYGPLREWIAQWQGVEPAQVLLANGSLQIVEFACFAMLAPGDVVLTESPTYDRTLTMLRRHGARVVGVRLEPDGPDLAALEVAMRQHRPKLFYAIPDFQNPAGATCSRAKREAIVEIAERHGVVVLEDAPYRLLRYRGQEEPTLRALAPGRVLHMGSFTKLIAPGVRVGYLLGEPQLITRIAKVAEDTYISPGYVAQAITWEWCRRGLLPAQIERLKALYAPRLAACRTAIEQYMPEAEATRPDGGFFLSLTLPPGVTTTEVRTAAARRNLNLADGLAFFPEANRDGDGQRFLRLPFCALTPEQIDEGVRRLADTVREVRG